MEERFMDHEIKGTVNKENTFDQLEMRLGKIISAELEPTAPKKAYKLLIDFGKFGQKISVGRFTQHSEEELRGKLVLGVLNFEPRQIGNVTSEVLVLGVQYPKADSGEATIITPLAEAKIGGKLF
jgi:tRNA-binding protein